MFFKFSRKVKIIVLLIFCASLRSTGQVTVTYYGDTLKGKIRKLTEYRDMTGALEGLRKSVYTCDIAKSSVTAEFDNASRWVVKYDNSDRIVETVLYCDSNTICQRNTCKYDADGRKIETRCVEELN